jgi:hypothetical protein
MKFFTKTLLGCALALGLMNTAAAYVGPGAGLSLLGALWGLLAAVLAAVTFIVAWPFRKMLVARRARATEGSAGRHHNEAAASQAAASHDHR